MITKLVPSVVRPTPKNIKIKVEKKASAPEDVAPTKREETRKRVRNTPRPTKQQQQKERGSETKANGARTKANLKRTISLEGEAKGKCKKMKRRRKRKTKRGGSGRLGHTVCCPCRRRESRRGERKAGGEPQIHRASTERIVYCRPCYQNASSFAVVTRENFVLRASSAEKSAEQNRGAPAICRRVRCRRTHTSFFFVFLSNVVHTSTHRVFGCC